MLSVFINNFVKTRVQAGIITRGFILANNKIHQCEYTTILVLIRRVSANKNKLSCQNARQTLNIPGKISGDTDMITC
jgi:hypothetical protein